MEESLEIIIDRSKFQKKKEDGRTNKGICLVYYKFFVSTRHQKIFLFCSMVIWQKKRQKTKMESFFLESFFFQGGMFCFFFKGGGSNLLYIFFSFLEVVTVYICNRQKTFLNIFFVFKFRKFRFWFFDAASVYRERARRFYIFFVVVCFFDCWWFFFVDKIKFVLLRWCYFKVLYQITIKFEN